MLTAIFRTVGPPNGAVSGEADPCRDERKARQGIRASPFGARGWLGVQLGICADEELQVRFLPSPAGSARARHL